MSQQDFDDIINNNEMIENTQIPTGGKWSEDGKSYSDRYGTIWRGDAANPGKLYAHIGGTEKEWSEVYGSDVPMPTYTPPTGTTGGYGGDLTGSSSPVVTPSRAAGAAPSGYADYLKGDGKGVAEGFDQAVAAARAEYERNRATFGARAESLGRAGLTGSGYGDYLEGKAFTAMQQKIGAAETAKAQSYADYLTQKEAEASSYAAYLSSEQQAEEEKVKTAGNALVAQILNSGDKLVSSEYIAEFARQNGVTFDEATLADIASRLVPFDISIVAQTEVDSQARQNDIKALVTSYSDTSKNALTVEGYMRAARLIMPDLTDEELNSMIEQIAARRGETLLTDAELEANNTADQRAAVIKAIKEWATSGNTIPTIEQIKNEAKTKYGIDLTEEDMEAISEYVKSETGTAPKTTEEVTNLSIRSWISDYQNEYGAFADSEVLERALRNSGVTDEQQIESAIAIYYDDNYFDMDKRIRDWDVVKNGSSDVLVANFNALALNDMVGKTITEEQAAELQKQVSAKLDEMFNAAFDSDNADEAQKILGVTFENVDNPGGEIAKMAYEAYSAGALGLAEFDMLLGKMVKRDIDNMGDNGEGEVTALMQTCGTIIDLIGEDEKLTALYKKYMEMCAKKIQKITYVEDFQEYGYKDLLLKVRIGGEEKSFSFGGTNSLVKGEDIQEKGENGDMVYKNGTLYICIGEENKWLPVKKLTGSGYLHTANERSEASVLYTLLSEVVKTRGRTDSFFNQLTALTTAQNHYGITGKGAPGYR